MTTATDNDLIKRAIDARTATLEAYQALTRARRGLSDDAAALIEPLRQDLEFRARALDAICDDLAAGRAGFEDDLICALEARGYAVRRVEHEQRSCLLCDDDAAPVTVWELVDKHGARVWIRACQRCGLAKM